MGFFRAAALSILLAIAMVLSVAYYLGDLDFILGVEKKPGRTHDRNY